MAEPIAPRISVAPDRAFSFRRIYALMMRYIYVLRGSWPRLLELMYWPVMQMILWGFMTIFLAGNSSYVAQAAGVLIAAVLLWDVLFRGELGVAICFLEEIWSRNLGHIFVSPLRPYEFLITLIVMSLIRTLIGIVPAAFLAQILYDYSVFDMGFALLAFFLNLIVMGWAMGLVVCGILFRWGLGAESLAWLAIFALAPVCGIYYPISVLPEFLQHVAAAIPASHVFEGMRSVLVDKVFRVDLLINAVLLNLVYLGAGAAAFMLFFRTARRRGLILQIGE
ncbi:MAG: ABC transporter permease [Alphaproteobacteria bacterium]